MKKIAVTALVLVLCGCAAKTAIKPLSSSADRAMPYTGQVCMLKSPLPPSVEHTVLAVIKSNKGTPGSVNELMGPIADDARSMGAHAVVNLKVWQKFNVVVAVRPVGSGTAVKLANPAGFDCLASSGELR